MLLTYYLPPLNFAAPLFSTKTFLKTWFAAEFCLFILHMQIASCFPAGLLISKPTQGRWEAYGFIPSNNKEVLKFPHSWKNSMWCAMKSSCACLVSVSFVVPVVSETFSCGRRWWKPLSLRKEPRWGPGMPRCVGRNVSNSYGYLSVNLSVHYHL